MRRAFGVGAERERVVRHRRRRCRDRARSTVPSSVAGSPVVRRSWLRSAPPSAVGGVSAAADTAGRVAARVERVAVLAVVGEVEARAVAAADVERTVGAERERRRSSGSGTAGTSPRSSTLLAARSSTLPLAVSAGEAAADDAAVAGRAGRVRARVGGTPGVPHRGAVPPIVARRRCRGRRRTASSGSSGASAMPSSPRSQKLWTLALRSAKIVGVGSDRLSKTLIRPLFSATKTRPSDANSTDVGLVRPVKTVVS